MKTNEERIAELEQKVSDLSDLIVLQQSALQMLGTVARGHQHALEALSPTKAPVFEPKISEFLN